MTRWTRSLTTRLAVLGSAWVTIGLVVMWFWVAGIVSNATERSFDARLDALLDAMVAITGIESGHPYLMRAVSEPRFDRPLSGVYYQIEGPDGVLITSRSLWDELLPRGKVGHPGVFVADIPGPNGQHLRMAERDIVLPGSAGIIHIIVAAAMDETLIEAARTRRLLAAGFLVLGAGLVGSVVLQVSLSLGGLRRLRDVVANLRVGGRLVAERSLPDEVQPLVQEIDALVAQNRATVERARGYVGNLAHALRTRHSIMRNALSSGDIALAERELTEADRLVQHHLVRARASSLAGTAGSSVAATVVAREIGDALQMLFADRALKLDVHGDSQVLVRCDRDDLAEILGNLMENACKWAATTVRVTVARRIDDVTITVSDDGAGLPASELKKVRDRGVRLDEDVSGSGLGLAIASDLVSLYQGKLELASPGPDGGLSAKITLPSARG